ncbi:MAG TPA: peptide deformylase [Phycisphaerales bacterium]|nr:peptide deformylase [Phycisphaerales bacterium]
MPPDPANPAPIDPKSLRLRTYPDPILRQKARPVPQVNDEVRAVAKAMLRIMVEEEGIGLAAPQVGLPWRLFVVDIPEGEGRSATGDPHANPPTPPSATHGPQVYINPVLSKPTGGVEPYEEGCLSLPDIRGDVLRPPTITITALDIEGNQFTHTATGLLARCWQHEFDHLDGVLIIDKMTAPYRLKNRSAIRDLEREAL